MATTAQQTLTRPKKTAEHFQVSHMTLYRWSKQDGFPQPLRRAQVVLYSVPAITAWLTGVEA